MASLIFASASSFVSPCETQPGSMGTEATNPPSASRSRMTVYFILASLHAALSAVSAVKQRSPAQQAPRRQRKEQPYCAFPIFDSRSWPTREPAASVDGSQARERLTQ